MTKGVGDRVTPVRGSAHARPVKCGALVIERISRLTPDADDPVGMYLVGSAASAVWAYDRWLGFLNATVDGLRQQGRLRLLAEALVAQAWAAVHQAREPLAVSAAEEASRLARETGELRWTAAAQLALAMIAAERGDFPSAEDLARGAEAHADGCELDACPRAVRSRPRRGGPPALLRRLRTLAANA
jgi:hypothetical protein